MSQPDLALALSVAALLGQGLNVWLKLRMRADLAEFEGRVLERIGAKYVPREVLDSELRRIDERCQLTHWSGAPERAAAELRG